MPQRWRYIFGGVFAVVLATAGVWWLGEAPTTRPTRATHDVLQLEPLTAMKVGELWGFANADGNIVIEPRFNFVQEVFHEERAYVQTHEGRGLIDREGNWRAGPKNWALGEYKEGRAAMGRYVGEDFKWGYIDGDGNEVIPPQWDAVRWFINGVAEVGNETWMSGVKSNFADINADIDWLYIDRDGNPVSAPGTQPATQPGGD